MNILVVKLTSMGDVLHMMPALTDLQAHFPQATIDWMVEEGFMEIPRWHPAVTSVIPVATRRWRAISRENIRDFWQFMRRLRKQRYDIVIDAQGLMKSAVIARLTRLNKGGRRIGFSSDSIKESPAAWFYHRGIQVPRQQHAIHRLRQLFAGAMQYEVTADTIDYALTIDRPVTRGEPSPSVMFFHGTTWPTKHLPDRCWRELADLAGRSGYQVKLCWGNEQERKRAEWIAQDRGHVDVLPKSTLSELAVQLSSARGAIAVDTGLGHLAAALGVPTVSVYGATDAKLTGAVGASQRRIQTDYACSPCLRKHCNLLNEKVTDPPCYGTLSMADVWQQLEQQIT